MEFVTIAKNFVNDCMNWPNSTKPEIENCIRNRIKRFLADKLSPIQIIPPAAINGAKIAPCPPIESFSGSYTSFTASLSQILNKPNSFLPFIPFLFLIFHSSKKKYADNIDINISAPLERKIYCISLEREDIAHSTSFEVAAGQPVRLLQQTNAAFKRVCNIPPKRYSEIENTENYKFLNINILESTNNEFLKKGPVKFYIPLSNSEFICINHIPNNSGRNKTVKKNLKLEDGSDWILRKITINVTGNKIDPIPLISPVHPKGFSEFLHIEQR